MTVNKQHCNGATYNVSRLQDELCMVKIAKAVCEYNYSDLLANHASTDNRTLYNVSLKLYYI